jgi:hypothetical protein
MWRSPHLSLLSIPARLVDLFRSADERKVAALRQVTGEVAELERALALAPRRQRADWVTRVQVRTSLESRAEARGEKERTQ